jgi:dephospho-CoA kinase
MFVVGLTGGIGSGKSTIANYFLEKDIVVVNTDHLSREVVSPGTPALSQIQDRFGGEIIEENGQLNRRKLREIIFSDDNERIWLETLLHPLINEALYEKVKAANSDYVVIESALLLETDQHKIVHRVLVVDVSEKTQVDRAAARDRESKASIKSIMASQLSRAARLKKADDVIDNELHIDSLHDRLEILHMNYTNLATK